MSKDSAPQQHKIATPMSTPVQSSILQRKCACGQRTHAGGECAECRKKRVSLQRQATNQAEPTTVPPIVHEVLRSPGQPLDPATRAFMEPRFGHDFSRVQLHTPPTTQTSMTINQPGDRYEQEADRAAQKVLQTSEPDVGRMAGHDFSRVRIHADTRAAESAQVVNALAYAVGQDVVFGAGQFAPQTTEGRRLLAHELTHVVQSVPQGRILRTPQEPREDAGESPGELAVPPIPTATVILVGSPTNPTKGYDKYAYNFSDAARRTVPKVVAALPGTTVTILYFSPGYKLRGEEIYKKALKDLRATGVAVVEVSTVKQVIDFLNTGLVSPAEATPTRAVKVSRFVYFGHGTKTNMLLNWGWGKESHSLSKEDIVSIKTEAFEPTGESNLFTCHIAEGENSFMSVWASHLGQTSIGPQGNAAFNARYDASDLEKAINKELPDWFLGLPYMNKVKIIDQ